MDASDEPERWCLQMYNKIASAPGDLTGLNVLEVGSGRGGGSSYTKRYLHPAKMTGLDYSSKAVDFCQEKHAKNVPGLTYLQGNAEDLPFGNDEFDVVINVESSHCYGHFDKFLSEVYRVLKPGGQFSWVDIRKPDALPGVEKEFAKSGFTELKSEDVTKNVVAAMSKSGENRLKLIQRRVPKFAQPIFHSFAGVEGTQPYKELTNREVVYTHKLLKKASD
ncbi:Phthiotriol/phenolphthiotriol dimycocerosates methyltransferase [Seminavis robusta]|uniref:Phthiotriol/phenolphthiotriol dimycocerosates methyltransferase n=1 Tax=Seminavis robusta TaxID=568900 RepID=A0A9N8EU68_9STRA|nr:Phthiotriol/phenolphthiotriol dimycocerosates methyltransferase [Seminavis robusta]|eukprot:Sro1976_g308860.1 Phthiotriol/phenolphthiotriol dimycocerosates methyltransferase (221) ;mRNA; f:6853-7515